MTTILETLREVRAENQKKYSTEIAKTWCPDPYAFDEIIWMGSYSFFLPHSRRRIIRRENLLDLGEGIVETPSATARAYLQTVYKHGPRVRHAQIESIERGMRDLPLMAKPCRFEHGYYIDIRAAFWSLMNIVGWDVDYWPEKWLGARRAPSDFPFPENSIARNCLESAGRITKIPVYDPRNPHAGPRLVGSKLRNLSLHRLIVDVLNTLAFQCEQVGAVYAYTDGFIAPDEKIAGKIFGVIEDWGLVARVKYEGAGGVSGSGGYRVGGDYSVPFRKDAARFVRKLRPARASKWLQGRLAFFAAERRLDNIRNFG